jgi:RHS repeat-associated protein
MILGLVLCIPAVALGQSEVIEYYGIDAIGSPRIVFDSAGNVVAPQDYLPFGMEMLPGTALPPETFGGDTADTETQQGYFIARQLAARNGRFLSVDFIGGESLDPQTLNRYSYARNNPERYIDPLGEDRPPNRIRPISASHVTTTTGRRLRARSMPLIHRRLL